ncbi:MAG TPA: glutamate racemase [Steroidobacteraceae bacterium]
MSALPIGVFDSGVGGLTVLKALSQQLPRESFIYLGDTARLPYGTKSPQTVARYALQAAQALAARGVKCIVIACNTASAAGLSAINQRLPALPIIGVIEPGAAAASVASQSGHIAVIATEATVRGGAYQQAILRKRPAACVRAEAAPLLVALAEEGLHEGPIAEQIASHYLEPIFTSPAGHAAPPDTLVLGCTHFPMLLGAIRRAVGPAVHIVDSAATTALTVQQRLRAAGLLEHEGRVEAVGANGEPTLRFLATDDRDRFARIGSRFLQRPIAPGEVELVDL